jgi:hypothetical protein
MNDTLLRGVVLDRASRKKDRSVSITFVTDKEQTVQEFSEIDALLGTGGAIYYKSGGIISAKEQKAIKTAKIDNNSKSKSQRLRGALYGLWNSLDTSLDFETFYAGRMEQMIGNVIGLINDIDNDLHRS